MGPAEVQLPNTPGRPSPGYPQCQACKGSSQREFRRWACLGKRWMPEAFAQPLSLQQQGLHWSQAGWHSPLLQPRHFSALRVCVLALQAGRSLCHK